MSVVVFDQNCFSHENSIREIEKLQWRDAGDNDAIFGRKENSMLVRNREEEIKKNPSKFIRQ